MALLARRLSRVLLFRPTPYVALAAFSLSACNPPSMSNLPPATTIASVVSMRQALEAAYDQNRRALLSNSPSAVLALRTDDFHVITPDGATHGPVEMTAFTNNLLTNVERWEALSFDLLTIDHRGEEVSADVRQHSVRRMRRPGGKIERVENWVTQRETWLLTPQGWKLRRVENIRDQTVLIDGVPRR